MFKAIDHIQPVSSWSDTYLKFMYLYYRTHYYELDSSSESTYSVLYNELISRDLLSDIED